MARVNIPGYRILRWIGGGASADVYEAVHERLARTDAIKVIRAPLADDATKRRFERECNLVGTLSTHSSIVNVYDARVTDDGIGYIAMPLYASSLATRIEEEGALSIGEVLDLGTAMCSALAHAHADGVWHRDVKPENILLDQSGKPVLTDFGVAVALSEGVQTSTAFTLWHAAPEVLRGDGPHDGHGPQADVYSLGSTLYTAVCGSPAFMEDREQRQIRAVEAGWDHLPRDDVPVELVAVLRKAMAPQPRDRYSDMHDFAAALTSVRAVLAQPRTPPAPDGPVPDIPGYSFVRTLGAGGFGAVHLFHERLMARDVAIKVPYAASPGDSTPRDLIDATAARLQHQHIAKIFGIVEATDGRRCVVMEYYPGSTLADTVANGPLQVHDVLRLGIQLSGALEVAHRQGIVHRDVKPANVLLDAAGGPYLADFGIARTVDAATDINDMISLPWSPPEVVLGPVAPAPSQDVYSLAATLWHLLAGRHPFQVDHEDDARDLAARVLAGDPSALARPDVPPRLEAVLRHAMAMSPADRPPSALSLARALQQIQRTRGLPVSDPLVPEQPRTATARPGTTTSSKTQGSAGDVVGETASAGATAPFLGHGAAITTAGGKGGPLASVPLFDDVLEPDLVRDEPSRRDRPERFVLPSQQVADTPPSPPADVAHAAEPVAHPSDATQDAREDPFPRDDALPRRSPIVPAAAAVALVLISVGGASLLGPWGGDTQDGRTPSPSRSASAQDVLAPSAVPAPIDGSVSVADGVARYSWSVTRPDQVAFFMVTSDVAAAGPSRTRTEEPRFVLTLGDGQSAPCIVVVSATASGATSRQVRICP